MAQKITKMHLKRAVSAFLAATTAITATPPITISAEETEKYPYTLFAGSYSEGAITTTAGNFCANGNVATNGTIVAAGNMNINGTKTENAGEEMIYIFNKIESKYFSGNNVDEYAEDYTLEEMNINVTEPLEVGGEIEMTGNINLTTAIKAYDTVSLNGEVKNTSESVICSETGDIIIDCTNVNLNGLVYAPDGSVEITAQNLNLNNVIIIADTILLDCPNVNANYGSSVAEFIGTESEVELHIYASGNYNKETDELTILWETTVPNGTFDIETSFDNKEYSTLVSVVDSNSYTYEIIEDFKKMYVRVTETTSYGETATSGPFEVKWIDDSYYVLPLDTDDDGLFDYQEPIHNTDINNPDTDGDGLTDAEEVNIIGSDPTIYDSIESGISDASADNDGDGLTNREEIDFQTNPISKDSDNDRMNDYDELYVWNTDPLTKDTDNDTIADGDEVKIGLIPTNPETFGYPDAEYKSVQTISADSSVLSAINTEDSPYSLSLEVTAAGYTESYLFGRESSYSGVMENEFMVGMAPELVYLGKHDVDSVKISFRIKDEFISENGDIRKYNVFKYFEEDNALLPIATYYDLDYNTLYTNTDYFGTYCLMDIEAWLEFLESASENVSTSNNEAATPMLMSINRVSSTEENLDTSSTFKKDETEENELLTDSVSIDYVSFIEYDSIRIEINDTKKYSPIDIVFILQSTGVSEDYFNEQREYIKDISELLFDYHPETRIKIINYYVNNSTSGGWFSDSTSINLYLDELSYTKTYSYCDRSNAFRVLMRSTTFREEASKFAIHFINGATTAGTSMIDHIYMCSEMQINYSEFMPLGYYYISDAFAQKVADAIYSTNGINEYFDYMDVGRLYGHIIDHTAKPQVLFTGIVPNGWKKITLNSPLTPDSKLGTNTDTDGDGLSDWQEVDNEKLLWDVEGKVIYPTLYEYYLSIGEYEKLIDAFYRNEYILGTTDISETTEKIDYLFNKVTMLPLIADPTSDDGDGDGILDIDEFMWNGIDERYKNMSPLNVDTIETLYPELNPDLISGNNSEEHAVYLEINENDITINASFILGGEKDKYVPLSECTRTMKELFLEGVTEYWSGTKNGDLFDFYPGMTVTTKVVPNVIDDYEEYWTEEFITVWITDNCNVANYVSYNEFLFAGGPWTTANCQKNIYLTPCGHGGIVFDESASCEKYKKRINEISGRGKSVEEYFAYTCAHEFGHILGIWDAYGGETSFVGNSANDGFATSAPTGISSVEKEISNLDIMRSQFLYSDSLDKSSNIDANNIEMMLQAFVDDDWQYFYEGFCIFATRWVDQKLSKAIKTPIPTYEKKNKENGNYDYYFYIREGSMSSGNNDENKPSVGMNYVGSGKTFPSTWIPDDIISKYFT